MKNNVNNVNPFIIKPAVEELPATRYYPSKEEERKVYRELYGTTNTIKALIPKKDY